MLDLSKYQCLGAALHDALDEFADEVSLIDADRERERERLTYSDFKVRAHALARALQEAGFSAGDRASIIMTNQSKWLISAYAIFCIGGVLVPLDSKLTPEEHWQLLKHSGTQLLVSEHVIWQELNRVADRSATPSLRSVLVTEAPPNTELSGAQRWEDCRDARAPVFVPRQRKDPACTVYSSGIVVGQLK